MKYNACAEVIKVVDGDTLHSLLDIGWGLILRPRGKAGSFGTVRVTYPDGRKWDAAEMSNDRGKAAQAYLQGMIRPGMHLEVVSHGLDSLLSRTVGSVTLPNGEDWATHMHAMGFTK